LGRGVFSFLNCIITATPEQGEAWPLVYILELSWSNLALFSVEKVLYHVGKAT
jgi:hypothetical protein